MSGKGSPVNAAKTLGIDTYTMANLLRQQAAQEIRSLAGDVERGNVSDQGDVDKDEFMARAKSAWRIVEAAKVCDIDWQRTT